MDDSDDYFTDDIILDEQALAVLDKEEQKFLTQVVTAPPVTKKQRTDHGWKPGLGTHSATLDDLEDLPEISLHGDGSYAVRGRYGLPVISNRNSPKPTSNGGASKSSVQPVQPTARILPVLGDRRQTNRHPPWNDQSSRTSQSRTIPRPAIVPQRLPTSQVTANAVPPPLGMQAEELQQKLQEVGAEQERAMLPFNASFVFSYIKKIRESRQL